jgi:hypothetical protein
MSARKELAEILEQWRQLTQEEGAAIRSGVWDKVRQIQSRKAALRKSLAAETAPPASNPFRAEVGRIISMLTRNSQALAARMRQAKARQQVLDQVKQNLQKIDRSYVRRQQSTAWQSYS